MMPGVPLQLLLDLVVLIDPRAFLLPTLHLLQSVVVGSVDVLQINIVPQHHLLYLPHLVHIRIAPVSIRSQVHRVSVLRLSSIGP